MIDLFDGWIPSLYMRSAEENDHIDFLYLHVTRDFLNVFFYPFLNQTDSTYVFMFIFSLFLFVDLYIWRVFSSFQERMVF